MRLVIGLSALAVWLYMVGEGGADEVSAAREAVKNEARAGFETILDMWRDMRYGKVYERVVPGPRQTRYSFVEQLNYSGRRPACCWEKLQDVSVTYTDDTRVTITARLGIEVEGVGTRFVTRSFHLVKVEGVWKVSAQDIISLAEPNFQRIPNFWPWELEGYWRFTANPLCRSHVYPLPLQIASIVFQSSPNPFISSVR